MNGDMVYDDEKINLSLDEIIHLNAVINNKKQEMESLKIYAKQNTTNGRTGQSDEMVKLPVHQRLGFLKQSYYKNSYVNNYNNLFKAKRVANAWKVQKGKYNKRPPVNPRAILNNPNAIIHRFHASPLTKNAVGRFNRLNNGMIKKAPSVSSRSVISSRTLSFRHSVQAAVSQRVQEAIDNIGPPSVAVDVRTLESFMFTPSRTMITSHDRFSGYN